MLNHKKTEETNNWNANKYNEHADFVSVLGMPVVELLNPKENEKILDLGSGDGTLAVEIEKYGADVIAVDLSEDMVAKSKAKGLESHVMSATELPYNNEFDAVFSNAVLHWIKDAELTIKKIHTSLKNEGRLVAEFGGHGNIKHLTEAMQGVFESHKEFGKFNNPWYFPSDKEYKRLLEANGFAVEYIELIPRPTSIDDITHWLDIFANGIVSHLRQDQKDDFKKEVRKILKPKIYTQEEGWVADYVRLRVHASKRN